jgi:hypothetical protein
MADSLPDYKRKALERRRTSLIEEFEAASAQLDRTLSDADRLRLQRQVNDLERQIQQVENELGQITGPGQAAAAPAKAEGDAQPAPQKPYGTGNRWAVLVGVNTYEDKTNYGQLHVCVKDVQTIHDQLVAGGFDPARIRLLTDETSELPTRENILVALKAVADATEPDDLLLFYHSGHGDEDDGESYLVARNGRRLVLGDTAVSVSRVKEIIEEAPARAKVIVLDACHSGADIGGKGPQPMSPEFIRRVFEQAEGLAILASCQQGQLSYEWQAQERSVFTHYLLEALEGQADRDEKGFVTVQDANRHVTNGVRLWASQHNVSQIPTLQYTVAGDIVLTHYTVPEQGDDLLNRKEALASPPSGFVTDAFAAAETKLFLDLKQKLSDADFQMLRLLHKPHESIPDGWRFTDRRGKLTITKRAILHRIFENAPEGYVDAIWKRLSAQGLVEDSSYQQKVLTGDQYVGNKERDYTDTALMELRGGLTPLGRRFAQFIIDSDETAESDN